MNVSQDFYKAIAAQNMLEQIWWSAFFTAFESQGVVPSE